MSDGASYRRILKTSSITGASSIVVILMGIIRIKFVAVLLGPAGVGLIGLYSQVVVTASTLFGLGLGNSGARANAEAKGEPARLASTWKALLIGTCALAGLSALVVWVLRGPLTTLIFASSDNSFDVGWLGVGAALTVVAASQAALMSGFRRIQDLAVINICASIGSTLIAVLLVLGLGMASVVFIVLVAPAISVLVSTYFLHKLKLAPSGSVPHAEARSRFGEMARLGSSFMSAGLMSAAAWLLLRVMITRSLGVDAVGQFQAASIYSVVYVGFVLSAMMSDFYPRLVEIKDDPIAANRLINEQVYVALLLVAPGMLAFLAVSPWLIQLMYSKEFEGAAMLVRWQVLGDILKIVSWPLAYATLAAAQGRAYFVSELISLVVLLGLSWLLMPVIGLQATAIAYSLCYFFYLAVVWWMARRRSEFHFAVNVKIELCALLAAAAAVTALFLRSELIGAVAGIVLALVFAVRSITTLSRISERSLPLAATVARWRRRLGGARGR
jgi:PST family polysaccharide transporter